MTSHLWPVAALSQLHSTATTTHGSHQSPCATMNWFHHSRGKARPILAWEVPLILSSVVVSGALEGKSGVRSDWARRELWIVHEGEQHEASGGTLLSPLMATAVSPCPSNRHGAARLLEQVLILVKQILTRMRRNQNPPASLVGV